MAEPHAENAEAAIADTPICPVNNGLKKRRRSTEEERDKKRRQRKKKKRIES